MLTPQERRALAAALPEQGSPGQRYLAATAARFASRQAALFSRLLAARGAAPAAQGFRVFVVKPVGNRCNLRCSYCFFPEHRGPAVMSREALAALIKGVAEAGLPRVDFIWHGGEPLLAGRGFYREARRLQRALLAAGSVRNLLMSNGTLVDREWAQFLGEHHFRLGLSIDGPAPVHDRHRRDGAGYGSFGRVVHGLRLARAAGVRVGAISVFGPHADYQPGELVELLSGLGVSSFRLNPCLDGKRGEGYPEFALGCAREALARGPGLRFTLLDDVWSALLDYGGQACWMAGTCRHLVGVEPDGSLWACCERHDREPGLRLGSIREQSLAEIWHDAPARELRAGDERRRAACRGCTWSMMCGGGCVHHRVVSAGDAAGEDPLCPAYGRTFALLTALVDDCLQGGAG